MHTRGRHGRPAEGIVVEPTGMVLGLAADIAGGVLHASRVPNARPQLTIQVYILSRTWPFSTWAALAIMLHRGGNRPGAPRLAGRPGLPLAQSPKRSPGGARGRGVQPRGDPSTTPRQEGAPLPADRYDPGCPARLRMEVGHRGGTTAGGPLDPPLLVLAHRCPGTCHPGHQRGLPAAPASCFALRALCCWLWACWPCLGPVWAPVFILFVARLCTCLFVTHRSFQVIFLQIFSAFFAERGCMRWVGGWRWVEGRPIRL